MSLTQVFQCPNCSEFINSSLTHCKFCSVAIDPQSMLIASTIQDKVNKACNHASLTRSSAAAMLVSFFARYIPLVGIVFAIMFIVTFFVTPFQLLIWLFKYRGIETADPDYGVAKKNILFAAITWSILSLITVVLTVLNFAVR